MPTGYTSIIEDKADVTFRDYAMRCARAFGACVMQRDESPDSPPRPREVSGHYGKGIIAARGRLLEPATISAASARALWEADCESKRRHNEEAAADHARKSAAYAAMRSRVEAWTPPTPDHVELRRFMLDQIDLCHRPEEETYVGVPFSSPETYVDAQREWAQRDLTYYAEEQAKEIERVEAANAWLKALLDALPEATAR